MAKLFYVIGASGSGKDSLIHYARSQLSEDAQVIFTHRYITRPADAGGENHVSLNENEFFSRKQMRCFAMSWYSHDTYYGIGIEINQWLALDLNVVVNGSRAYLNKAAKKYTELIPVLISVDQDVLRDRLKRRGRENDKQIEHRLKQARDLVTAAYHPQLIKIENNGPLERAGEKLMNIIFNEKQSRCA